ncbi:Palmitoyltransferase ERF2 [Durusdinium trenchii]|uniref:Palmitoyltransferase ERF2 n=1 Tax=Durusdinium trenchii TaxID=1381693 RepID=A0ABP0QQU1_9DINO
MLSIPNSHRRSDAVFRLLPQRIQSIQKRNAKSLRITAELQWQQDERSPVQRRTGLARAEGPVGPAYYMLSANSVRCTDPSHPGMLLMRLSFTSSHETEVSQDLLRKCTAEANRTLSWTPQTTPIQIADWETVTVVGDCCTTDGTDLPAPVELLAGAEPLGVDAFTGRGTGGNRSSGRAFPLLIERLRPTNIFGRSSLEANRAEHRAEHCSKEIPASCAALEVGTSCEVSCNSQIYITNRQPVGQLPDCVLKSSQNHQISSGSSPPAPPSGPPAVPNCNACAAIRSWSDPRFAQCRAWGDPHFIRSWRPNQKRFDYQGSGVVRYASSGQCGGQFELQAFQCQYKSGRNAVMIGLALRVDGETVYIADTSVTSSGAVQVSPSSIENDRTGINLQSSDGCIFLNVNRKQINANPKYFHNIKLSVLNEDVTQEGVCGAENLLNERVDPTSNEMLFTAAQHRQLRHSCDDPKGRE